jgi:lysophospholipase L1-like esterase
MPDTQSPARLVRSSWSHGIGLAVLAAAVLAGVHPARAAAKLEKGDRVVFLGDSITQAGAAPGGYVTRVAQSLAHQHPELGVEVIGAGISGNRVPDLENRLERDVIAKKPTVVVIYIGINDVWHSLQGRGTPKDEYEQGLRRITRAVQDAGARTILCTPSVIGEKPDGSNALDAMLDDYAAVSRRVAADTHSQLLDLRKAFLAYLRTHNPDSSEKNVLTSDGVHLNPEGNRFVAERVLEALGAAEPRGALLRHVVLFKFKDAAGPEQVREVVDAFAALAKKIDLIVDFERGSDVSVENKSEGFTHAFVVTFRSEKDRDTYLTHPAHQEFVKLVGPRLDKVLVFDYRVER